MTDLTKTDRPFGLLDAETQAQPIADTRFVTAGLRAHQASESFHSAYWAESHHRLDLHRKNAITALREAAEAVGLATVDADRLAALEAFIEEVATAKPEIISGRAHNPEDDLPDYMEADWFLDFQADARKLMEKV